MTTVDIHCRVEAYRADGPQKVIAEKTYEKIDVMKMKQVRSWVRKQYNKALREAGDGWIVSAQYRGQLDCSPYHSHYGSLSGVNGQTMRVDGEFAQ